MPAEHALDRVIAAAWPAGVEEVADGWIRRATDGQTRRANSALVVGTPNDLDAAIDGAEDFYRRAQRPTLFLVSDAGPTTTVAARLIARGYESTAPTWVLTMTEEPESVPNGPWTSSVSGQADDVWFDVYWDQESSGDSTIVRDVLLQPAHPAAFVTVRSPDGSAAAVGQVVVVDGWGCVQCLVTAASARRRGAGRAVVLRLMEAATRLGADAMVAAVMIDNEASLRLFEQLGFEPTHRYSYYRR